MDTTTSIQWKFMCQLDGQARFNSIETSTSIGWTQRPPPHAGSLALRFGFQTLEFRSVFPMFEFPRRTPRIIPKPPRHRQTGGGTEFAANLPKLHIDVGVSLCGSLSFRRCTPMTLPHLHLRDLPPRNHTAVAYVKATKALRNVCSVVHAFEQLCARAAIEVTWAPSGSTPSMVFCWS